MGNQTKYNGFAIAGFVVSLVSLFITLWGIPGILGIVLSAIGLSQIKTKGEKGKGLAIAGLIIGIVSTIWTIIFIATCTSVFV